MNEKIQNLLQNLKAEDAGDRRYAAEDLMDLKDPVAAPYLVEALTDVDTGVREAVVDALIAIGGLGVSSRLVTALEAENVTLRNHAVEILSQLKNEDLSPLFDYAMKSPSADVRKFALDVINTRNTAELLTNDKHFLAVTHLLSDTNLNVSSAAVEALGRSRRAEALPLLKTVKPTPSWMAMVLEEAMHLLSERKAS